jgi:hypothetical protein
MKLEGAAHPFAGSIAGKMRAAPPCPFFDVKVKTPRGLEPWIPTLSKNKGATVTLTSHSDKSPVTLWIETWRKRVGVEPTDDGVTRRPPVLKITMSVPTGYENSLLYLILQPLTKNSF